MNQKSFSNALGANGKTFAINIILIANAFVWYFFAFDYLAQTLGELSNSDSLIFYGTTFLSVFLSAIIGVALLGKFKRRMTFLKYWMAGGALLSFAPIAMLTPNLATLLLVTTTMGAYFGLGMPICMGYFAATTEPKNRARTAGFTVLVLGLGVFLLGNLIDLTNVFLVTTVLSVWRIVGLLLILPLRPPERLSNEATTDSYRSVIKNKQFMFYFLPWLLFLIVNNMALPIQSKILDPNFVYYSSIVESAIVGGFAVIAGFIADLVGRKRLALLGFALLGAGYAILSFSSMGMIGWWFYTVVDGIAFGAFYTILLMTVWGDLAQGSNSEKFYVVGALPYLLSNFIRYSLGSYIALSVTNFSMIFSLSALFLFAAVLPLFYAPETLSEKIMKERALKSYADIAQQMREKYS